MNVKTLSIKLLCPRGTQTCALPVANIANALSRKVNGNGKVMLDTHPDALLGGSQNFEIRSRDPGHAHLGVVLLSGRSRGPSSMSVPNLKRIALFVQKLLGDVGLRRKSNENRQFSHPRVFNAPAEGVPLGIWYPRRGRKKLD